MNIQLSALELFAIDDSVAAETPVLASLEIAPLLERLAFSRYWMAEHHTTTCAASTPEVMIAIIAGLTERIRVGSAGVLLRYHSPQRVAEAFLLLELLYPGRIDLGVVSGLVRDAELHARLSDGQPERTGFDMKVSQLNEILNSRTKTVEPTTSGVPPLWLMGTSVRTAKLAGRNGAAFCLSCCSYDAKDSSSQVVEAYKATFIPSNAMPEPTLSIAVAGVCASSESEARRRLGMNASRIHKPTMLGSPDYCAKFIRELCAQVDAQEVIYIDLCGRLHHRVQSYELLSECLRLR